MFTDGAVLTGGPRVSILESSLSISSKAEARHSLPCGDL